MIWMRQWCFRQLGVKRGTIHAILCAPLQKNRVIVVMEKSLAFRVHIMYVTCAWQLPSAKWICLFLPLN